MDNEKKIELKDITIESLEKEGVVQKPSYFDYRMGWMIGAGGLEELPYVLRTIGKISELDWQQAIRRGECPSEDVSPAEGYEELARRLEELLAKAKSSDVKVGD